MKQAITCAALLCAALSYAAPVARQGTDAVQLLETPCPAAVPVDAALRDQYAAAVANIGGTLYAACWLAVPARGFVHLVFQDGDVGIVPFQHFKDEPGI
jgi:hypothetical protein